MKCRKKCERVLWFAFILGLSGAIAGCGGATEDFADVEIHGTATADGQMVLDMGNGNIIKQDASDTGTGTGTGGPTSINDTATVACAFSLTSNQSAGGEVKLAEDVPCASPFPNNENNCIRCDTTASGNTCAINCSGKIPSRTDVANDHMTIRLLYTSTFNTNMPDVTEGGVQFVGNTSGWPVFHPNTSLVFDSTGCNNEPVSLEMGLGTLDGSSSINSSSWDQRYPLATAGTSNGCTTTYQTDGDIFFTGAQTPNTTIQTQGNVTMTSTICDLKADCQVQ